MSGHLGVRDVTKSRETCHGQMKFRLSDDKISQNVALSLELQWEHGIMLLSGVSGVQDYRSKSGFQ